MKWGKLSSAVLALAAVMTPHVASMAGQARVWITVGGTPLRLLAEVTVKDRHITAGGPWPRRDRICRIAQLAASECEGVHDALVQTLQRVEHRGSRLFTMSFGVAGPAAQQVDEHLHIAPYDRHTVVSEGESDSVKVELDVFQYDTYDTWLDTVCKTQSCKRHIGSNFDTNPLFTRRFTATGQPNLAHEGLLPSTDFPSTDLSMFGPGLPMDFQARQVALSKHSQELTEYLKMLQQTRGWVLENDFYMEGGLFEFPAIRDIVFNLAVIKQAAVVCEIGFNTGHSALMWLLASSHAKVVSFDIMRHPYNKAAADFLHQRFPDRLQVVAGNSTSSVSNFAAMNQNEQCDIVFIDGDHNYQVPYLDIVALRAMSHETTIVLMDDLHCHQSYWCNGPSGAWHRARREHLLRELECFLKADMTRGLCTGQYLFG